MTISNDPSTFGTPVPPGAEAWVALTERPLPCAQAQEWVVHPECGAVATFTGIVRNHNNGREGITHIDYESYPGHAERVLGDIAALCREYWPAVRRIAVLHRTGRVLTGQASVICCVSAPHRHEAIEAMTFCIDVLKASAPLWKTEHARGGTAWPDNGTPIRSVRDAADAWWDDRGVWPAMAADQAGS